MLRTTYRALQTLLARFNLHLSVTRISDRNQPEVVNRAIWRPFIHGDKWRSLYNTAQELTRGTSTDNIFRQCRLYSTLQLAGYAARLPDGDVIECGCWHGHSTVGIASLLAEHGFGGRFHVFDSFEGGLSAFGEKDASIFVQTEKEKREHIETFVSDYNFVRSVTERFSFVDLHRGWIPAVFTGFEPRSLRFVHIDVDMYEPTKAALELFWKYLVPGGIIVIDDYSHSVFEGATRAVDEFLTAVEPRMVYKVPMGSSWLMK